MWGKRHSGDKTPDGGPPIIPVRRSSLCYLLVAFSSSKDTLFGVCTLLQRRLKRNGAKGFLRVTKGVLRYAIRLVGGAGVNHSRVGGIGDVLDGASLAVRKRP